MQSHLTPTLTRGAHARPLPNELEPGFGAPDLHLGQSQGQVIDLWNEPDRKEQLEVSQYFIYDRLKLEVEFQKGRVERLFFFKPAGSKGSIEIRRKQVSYGMSRTQLVRKFGKPAEQGKGRTILDKYVRSWISYPTGVQFEFGKNGKLELITIFWPEKT
jgi:hypothetical protein